jgi:hypothetical protein
MSRGVLRTNIVGARRYSTVGYRGLEQATRIRRAERHIGDTKHMAGKVNIHEKLRFKMEQVARYRVAGKKDAEIARLTGLTASGVARLVADEDYKMIAQDVQAGLLGKMDSALHQRADALELEINSAVPAALQCIIDTAKGINNADLKTRMMASKEVLDRAPDSRFTKKGIGANAANNANNAGAVGLPPVLMATLAREHDDEVAKLKQHAADAASLPKVVSEAAPGVN